MAPDVTIGLPVRNGGEGLERAIHSLLSQSYPHFALIISDNASDDGGVTEAICRRFAAADPRIRYIRQAANLGNPGNFRFTLMEASTPYFMWAAHDDEWAPDFIAATRAVLEADPAAVACAPEVLIVEPDGATRRSTETGAIVGVPAQRLRHFFWKLGDCSRFYALHRTDALRRSFPEDAMVFGFDWIVCALSLVQGHHRAVDRVLLTRAGQADGHYFRTLLRHEPNLVDRLLPFRRFTLRLRRHLPPALWRASWRLILRLNLVQGCNLLVHRLPMVRPAVRSLSWIEARLRTGWAPR